MRCRGCLQIVVKFLNLLLLVIGVVMILYSLLMLRQFKHHKSNDDDGIVVDSKLLLKQLQANLDIDLPAPWFIYCSMGVGIVTCLITLSGYIAAEAASACCLCCHSVALGIFLLVQAALAATIFFDHSWEQDFPEDPTGQLHDIRTFVEKNFDFCKWLALSVVVLEGLTLLLSMVLRAVVGDFRRPVDDSDDEYIEAPRTNFRQPLLGRSGNNNNPTDTRSSHASSRVLPQRNTAPEQENKGRCALM